MQESVNNHEYYFFRETRKSTYFTQIPARLPLISGIAQFDNTWAVKISRIGDYLLHTWLRVTVPSITITSPTQFGGSPLGEVQIIESRVRWTRNLMHNLIKELYIC